MNRRDFLNLGLVTAATATLAGCGRPTEQAFVSEALLPEFILPGVAQWYATTCTECGTPHGIAVRIIGGRAKKVEGLPTHPISHGGHCVRSESALQALYNPDRLGAPLKRVGDALQPQDNWDEALKTLSGLMAGPQGSALWITGPLRGTLGAVITLAARKMGAKIWVLDAPGTRVERAAMKAVGEAAARLPWHDLANADYVANFGADFLGTGPNSNEYSWAFGQFRNGPHRDARGLMVSFASHMNLTVGNSDRWVPVKPGTEGFVAAAVGNVLAQAGKGAMPAFAAGVTPQHAAEAAGIEVDLIHRLAEKLKAAKRPLVFGGYDNAAYSNGLWTLSVVNALNRMLSADNRRTYEPDVVLAPKGAAGANPADLMVSTRQAVEALQRGTYKVVVVAGANPAYQLPTKLGIGAALGKAQTIVFTPYVNESAAVAQWVLPTTSFLEEWGDTRVDGPNASYGLQQPVTTPRPGSMPLGDVLLLALGTKPAASMKDLVQGRLSAQDWLKALERGGIWKDVDSLANDYYAAPAFYPPTPPDNKITTAPPSGVSPWTSLKASKPAAATAPAFTGNGEYTLLPYPTPIRHDGSLANRPWIPEIPDPMAQAVWTTWVEINPLVAERMEIRRGDLVKLESATGSITLPALPLPTVHEDVVAVPMGMGHTSFGRYAFGKGTNPMDVVTPTWQDGTDEPVWAGTRVRISKTGQKGVLVTYDHRFSDDRFFKPYSERDLEE